MITSRELRIGNLILCRRNSMDWYIHEVTVFDIGNLMNDEYKSVYETIPLTEDWLFKFGFVKCVWGNISKEINFHQSLEYSNTILFLTTRGMDHDVTHTELFHINTVHQLQNLYFALTDKELEIK